MKVAFLDLTRQTEAARPQLDQAIDTVLRSGRFILDERCRNFEAAFAAMCGAQEAIGVGSGTDALTIALQAVGIRPGDEVVTVPNTCVPTIVGIEAAGARPVLADVDPRTLTLSPGSLEEALTPRTTAVVPVHLYGQTGDLDGVLALAGERGLKVVEDCAQAHGARWNGRPAGSLGDAAAFSFYPTKNLGALGDGGAVTTSDAELAARARLLRNYGERDRFEHVLRGWNSRLDELQAAVLEAKLSQLEAGNTRRRAIAAVYDEALADSGVVAPHEAPGAVHVYHLYVVRAPVRDTFREALAARGIATAIHYPTPVHRQPAYLDLSPNGRSLSVAEAAAGEIVSIPLYPELTDDEVSAVAAALHQSAHEQS